MSKRRKRDRVKSVQAEAATGAAVQKVGGRAGVLITKPEHSLDKYLAVLFIGLIGIGPLLVRARADYFISPRLIAPLLDTGWHVGLFTHYKWLGVVLVAGIALCALLYKAMVYRYPISSSYINGPLLGLTLLTLVSVLAADYKSVALFGIYNQGDGALLLLAYLALLLVAANISYPSWFGRAVEAALLLFTLINTSIILWHFSGHNPLEAAWLQSLVADPELRGSLLGEMTNTMGNTNYISGFGAALFAFFSGRACLGDSGQKLLLTSIGALAAFSMVVASLSRSGFVTVLVMLPLLVGLVLRHPRRRRAALSIGWILAGCLVIYAGLYAINPGVAQETFGVDQQERSAEQAILVVPESLATADPEFQLPQPAWSAGTGRTYIWTQTAALILDRPLWGYGPGTLAYYFPQNDIAKVANLNDYHTLVTKPHNMYLAIAFGLGLPALLCLLLLLSLHLYHTARCLWRCSWGDNHAIIAPLFLFSCAFLVQALFNDVMVEAGAVFWVLLGVAVAINRDLNQA